MISLLKNKINIRKDNAVFIRLKSDKLSKLIYWV